METFYTNFSNERKYCMMQKRVQNGLRVKIKSLVHIFNIQTHYFVIKDIEGGKP